MKKVLKIMLMILKIIATLFVILVFAIIFLQRVSGNKLNLGGYAMYTVVSESMLPKYELFDMLLSKEVALNDINVGDDIVYLGQKSNFKDKIVTHRVIEINKNTQVIKTKGINNNTEDPEITYSQVLGKVVHKSNILSMISHVVNNIYGFYFVVFVPLTVIIFLEIVQTVNERKQLKNEE